MMFKVEIYTNLILGSVDVVGDGFPVRKRSQMMPKLNFKGWVTLYRVQFILFNFWRCRVLVSMIASSVLVKQQPQGITKDVLVAFLNGIERGGKGWHLNSRDLNLV